MSEIDNRIVQMRFDNNQFEAGVSQTLDSLDRLREGLNLEGAVQGIDGISSGINKITDKFSLLGMIGMEAMHKIASGITDVIEKSVRFASGIDQMRAGFSKFEQKTSAVGTLVAQGFELEEVNDQLDRLNWFTDETSYNFTDMVASIGKFTATGKSLTDSVDAMEGIALWAALSGQNAQKASQAMYQLSQALGSGYMRKEDYKSIQNVSMDTDEFRQIALDTAVALGTLKKTGDNTYKSLVANTKEFTKAQFAEHLTQDQWFNSDVMMEVYKKYASATQKIYEYAKKNNVTTSKAIEALGDQVDALGLKALKAGQEARTFSDVMSAVADTVATSWMQTFTYIFGDYDEAVALWTDLVNRIIEITDVFGSARNDILATWKDLGGREDLITAYTEAFDGFGLAIDSVAESFMSIIKPVKDVDELLEDLYGLTDKGDELINNIKNIKNLMSNGLIPKDVGQKQLDELYEQLYDFNDASFIIKLTKNMKEAATRFKEFFEAGRSSEEISYELKNIKNLVSNGLVPKEIGQKQIDKLTEELNHAIQVESNIKPIQTAVETIAKTMRLVGKILTGIVEVGLTLGNVLGNLGNPLLNFVNAVVELIAALLDLEHANSATENAFKGISGFISAVFTPVVNLLATAINWLTEQINLAKEAISDGSSPFIKALDWIINTINQFIEGVMMYKDPLAKSLGIIGEWIIEVGKLFGGAGTSVAASIGSILGKIAASASELLAAFFDQTGIVRWSTIFKLFRDLSKTTILISIATGFYNLAQALGSLNGVLESAKKFIEGVDDAIDALGNTVKNGIGFLTDNKEGLGALINNPHFDAVLQSVRNLSITIFLLAAALYLLGQINPDSIGTIFMTLAGALIALAAAAVFLDKTLDQTTILKKHGPFGLFGTEQKGNDSKYIANLLLKMSGAILILAFALKVISDIDSEKLMGSVLAIGALMAMLVGVAYAFREIDKGLGKSGKLRNVSKGLLEFAIAIVIIAQAVKTLGGMTNEQLIAGVIALGGVLLELGLFMRMVNGMKLNMGSALGILIISAAIKTLIDSISALGQMDTEVLIQGLIALGAVLLELGVFTEAISGDKIFLASVSIVILAGALSQIIDSVQTLGKMNLTQLAVGLSSFAGVLIMVAGALIVLGNQKLLAVGKMMLAATVMLVMAAALKIIADVVVTFSSVGDDIANGLIGLAGTLIILGLALVLIGSNALQIIAGSIALSVAAGALTLLAFAFNLLRGLDADDVIAMLGAMGGSLLILTAALLVFGTFSGVILAGVGVLLAIAAAFAVVGAIVIGLGTFFLDVLIGYADGSKALADAVNTIINLDADKFAEVMKKVAGAYAEFGTQLKSFDFLFSAGQADALKKVSEGIVIAAPGLETLSKIAASGNDVGKVMTDFAAGIGEIAKQNKNFFWFADIGASAMLKISEAISKMAPGIAKLASVKDVETVGAVMHTLAVGIGEFGKQNKNFGPLANTGATAMLKIGEAIKSLADAFVKFDGVSIDIPSTLVSLGHAFALFGHALKESPFFMASSRAEGLGVLASNVGILADGLKKMGDVPAELVNESLQKIADAFKTFGQAIEEVPYFSPKNRAEAMGILVKNIETFANAIPLLADLKDKGEDIKSAVTIISESFSILGTALNSTTVFGAKGAGEGISELVGSIDELVAGLKSFIDLGASTNDISNILTTIGNGFKEFAVAINSTGFWAEGRATGITKLVDSTGTLGEAVKGLTGEDVNVDKFQSVLTAIGEGYKSFGSAISMTGLWAEGRAEGISKVVETTTTLANSIKELTGIEDADKVNSTIDTLTGAIKKIGEAINATGFWAEGKAEGISTVSSAINNDIVPAMQTLSSMDTEMLTASAEGIGTAITTLKTSLSGLTTEDTENASAITAMTGAIDQLINSIIGYDLTQVVTFGSNLVNSIIEGVNLTKENLLLAFETIGLDCVTKFINAIDSKKNDIYKATYTATGKAKDAAELRKTDFYNIGMEYMVGLANGIRDNTYLVVSAAEAAAAAAKQAAMDALGVKSPSKVGHWIGMNFDIGIGNGILDFASYVNAAANSMADSIPGKVVQPLQDALTSLNENSDFTPTITPVINLDNATASSKVLGSMIDTNKVEMAAASMSINSQITQMDQLVDMTSRILGAVQNGSDLYLDDSILAGRINRRLGVL